MASGFSTIMAGDAGCLGRLEELQPRVGRDAHLRQVRLFALEHLAVVGIALLDIEFIGEFIQLVRLPGGNCHKLASFDMLIGIGVVVARGRH